MKQVKITKNYIMSRFNKEDVDIFKNELFIYLLAITGLKWLGAITPIGGMFFILGWMFLFMKSLKI